MAIEREELGKFYDVDDHGGKIFEAARRLKVPWTKIIDFSANINPFGQIKGLKKHLFSKFNETLNYPDQFAQPFLQALAAESRLPVDCFLPGAGSTVHIYLLARLFGDGLSVIVGPAFSEYEAALMAAGGKFVYVNAAESDDFLLTEKILEPIFSLKPKAIFLANPANPSGRLAPHDLLLELLELAKAHKSYLVADEAFLDFTAAPSLVPHVGSSGRLAVLRSLTKIMAIPGLRLAYLASSPALVKKLWAQLGPWPLSSQAMAAGRYYLNSEEKNLPWLVKETRSLKDELIASVSPYGQVFPSDANFLLCKFPPKSVDELIRFLFFNAILVRDARNFNGLSKGFLRLAVRPKKEIRLLAKFIKAFYA